MAMEYLGSKEGLLDFVLHPIEEATAGRPSRVADLFCGTAAVSAALKRRGHTVLANDSLAVCATLAEAVLLNHEEPSFTGVISEVNRGGGDPYRAVLAHLAALPPRAGFVTHSYSPAAVRHGSPERRYFTEENALRIDAVRAQIRRWGDRLRLAERALLLADLVRAAGAVSNIAGTYGCYLKHWKPRALEPLRLVPSIITSGGGGHAVSCADALLVAPSIEADVVYADPPYTKRQYSAYYHVPETIVRDDAPILSGSTGLRPWREQRSAWCYRRQAPAALAGLVAAVRSPWFLLSYNEDGQIRHDEILAILAAHGRVTVHERDSRRYKSADRPHRGHLVRERIYVLRRAP